MKKLVAVFALTAVIASPALAASNHQRAHVNARAQLIETPAASNGPYNVYDSTGHVIGVDPDVNIRTAIRQNATSVDAGL